MSIKKEQKNKPWYKKIYDAVEGVLQKFFQIVTKIILALCYWTVFAATAIILKATGKSFLPDFKEDDTSFWLKKEKMDRSIDRAARQG